MIRAFDPADLRIVVRVTAVERDALAARCREDFRTVGSWFRLQVRRAWRARNETPRQAPPSSRRRKQVDGVRRHVAIWARLNGEEREHLEVLTEEEGVSVSIWFRRRMDAELGPVANAPASARGGSAAARGADCPYDSRPQSRSSRDDAARRRAPFATLGLMPFSSTLRSAEPTHDGPAARTAPARVLVVDDDPLILRAMTMALRHHDVVATTEPHAALERIARGERFDVLFCDAVMPDLDGFALFAEVRRMAPELSRGFVLLSGALDERREQAARELHLPVLEKPFDLDDLEDWITRCRSEVPPDGLDAPGR